MIHHRMEPTKFRQIPKIIFQTWKTREIPDKWKEGQRSIIQMNPKWIYVLITDEDAEKIVRENFPHVLPKFKAFRHGISRADAIRYMILYLYGGIYLDLDYKALKSFDDVSLPEEKDVGIVPSFNTFGHHLSNSFMMSRPGATFLLNCIDEMMKPANPFWSLSKHIEVMNVAGPNMVQRVYTKNPGAVEVLRDIVVPCNICAINKGCPIDSNYYLWPLKGGSWHSWDTALLNFVYCHAIHITVIVVILVVLIWGWGSI